MTQRPTEKSNEYKGYILSFGFFVTVFVITAHTVGFYKEIAFLENLDIERNEMLPSVEENLMLGFRYIYTGYIVTAGFAYFVAASFIVLYSTVVGTAQPINSFRDVVINIYNDNRYEDGLFYRVVANPIISRIPEVKK